MNNFTIFADHKALGTFVASFTEANNVARRLKAELPQTSIVLRRAQEEPNIGGEGDQLFFNLFCVVKPLINPWALIESLDQAIEDADWYYAFSDCGDTYRRGKASVEKATRLYEEALAVGDWIAEEAEVLWQAAQGDRR